MKSIDENVLKETLLSSRNFTATVKSTKADLFFLKRRDFEDLFKYVPDINIKLEVDNRMALLRKQINCIRKIALKDHKERQSEELAK